METGSNTLVGLEQDFRELVTLLEAAASDGVKLTAIARFLEPTALPAALREPYLLELGQYLPDIAGSARSEGLDPGELQSLLDVLDPRLPGHPEVGSLALLQWLRVGEVDRAAAVLGMPPGLLPMREYREEEARWLERCLDSFPVEHPGVTTMIEGARGRLLRETNRVGPVISVPVIERVGGFDHAIGAMRALRVEIRGASRGQEDRLEADVAVFGGRGLSDVPGKAVRALLAESFPVAARRGYAGRIDFEAERGLHSGRSGDLAIALSLLTAMLQCADLRVRPVLAVGVAATGVLEVNGTVLPVEEGSLRKKVEAAFFSSVATLVVPRVQLSGAEELVAELRMRYPARTLAVVGVGSLAEALYDRRIVRTFERPRTIQALRRVWDRRYSVWSLVLLATVSLLVWRVQHGPVDRNPASVDFGASALIVRNQYGNEIVKIDVRPATASIAARTYYPSVRAMVADLNRDGVNEVLWAEELGASGESPVVRCSTLAGTGPPVNWTTPLSPSDPGAAEQGGARPQFGVDGIVAGPLFSGDEHSVYITASDRSAWPAYVARLDATTGRVTARYDHAGGLPILRSYDVDGDGVIELVAGGTNQTRGAATVLLLDPRHLSGHGPAEGKYLPVGASPGLERWAVIFPRTRLGSLLAVAVPRQYVFRAMPKAEGIEIQLVEFDASWVNSLPLFADRSLDSLVGAQLLFHGTTARVLVEFGRNMTVRSVETSDQFDGLFRLLVDAGRLDLPFRKADLDAYREGLEWWNGRTWVRGEPVENMNYTQAVAASNVSDDSDS